MTALTLLFGALLAGPVAADEVSKAWLDLWTRCRVAIETAKPLDASGLFSLETSPDVRQTIERRRYDHWRLWGSANNRFAILDMERRVDDGVQRSCDVSPAPNGVPLTELEVGTIVREFLVERAKLIAGRTHVANELDPIYPLVPLGLRPIKPNPNKCSVISAVFFEISADTFFSLTGEQVGSNCSGPSKLGNNTASDPTGRP